MKYNLVILALILLIGSVVGVFIYRDNQRVLEEVESISDEDIEKSMNKFYEAEKYCDLMSDPDYFSPQFAQYQWLVAVHEYNTTGKPIPSDIKKPRKVSWRMWPTVGDRSGWMSPPPERKELKWWQVVLSWFN